ncbi:hypothetical protein M9H77_03018 [Catharanthus roseus]|uniref:Uncharacterized protein n=1 Tax=Catharanthus roseus TaxID=4058 RepID=A0ACC0CA82_CATRO|nr:hypothetical protein M9H77_03018 [Catharanthus roseus]
MVVEFVQSETSNTLLGIEVVLWFNSVEDLKGFKIKQFVPRESLEELKGFKCAVCKRVCTDSTNETLHVKGIALKAEHNSPDTTPCSEEEMMMLRQDFGKFFIELERHPSLKQDQD